MHAGGQASSTFRLDLILGCLLLVVLYAGASWGLIVVGRGHDPVRDNDWPAGSLDVANLKTRVGWWEGPPYGGGQHQFLYRGDTKAFQAALDVFAKINAPELRLVVHPGPHHVEFLKGDKDPKADTRVDWTFTVWNPRSWNHLFNNPKTHFSAHQPGFRRSVDAPQLDVYLGGGGGVEWAGVKVPGNVKVTDERASAAGIDAAGGGAARGEVTDIVTSKPIERCEVVVQRHAAPEGWVQVSAARTDADGQFLVRGVPPGSYRLAAAAPEYAPRALGYAEFKPDTLKQLDTRLAEAASISGTCVGVDGKPLAGVRVRADNAMSADGRGYEPAERPEVTTDADGRFRIGDLPEGKVQLFAHAPNFWPLDPLTLRSVPAERVTLRLTPTGVVRGRVLRPADGGPGHVSIQPADGPGVGKWSGSGRVGAGGEFEFDNVPPGDYLVGTNLDAARAGDRKADAKPVRVEAGKVADVEVVGR